MKKKTKIAWFGAIGAAAFALWKAVRPAPDILQAQANWPKPALPTTDKRSPESGFREPSDANGHVRDVVATDLPRPESGNNFSVQGDVHEPGTTENNP